MSKFPRFQRLWWRLALVLAGGGLFALDSCDPNVKSTVLSGLQDASTGLADTFIQAVFLKLQASDQTGTTTGTTTTTLLQTAHDMLRMLA
jgi:hypothetical protein